MPPITGASRKQAGLYYDKGGAVVNPAHPDFETDPTGVTECAAGLNLAAQAAGVDGTLLWPPGAIFKTASTVTVLGAAVDHGSAINYSGAGDAVHVGDGTNIVQSRVISLPRIFQTAKTALGWGVFSGTDISASVGVKLQRVFNCKIFIQQVRNFAFGLLEYGIANGSDYNTIFIGHLSNNKINLKIDADATGWVNENAHFGGRLSHDTAELQGPNTTATGQPGVRHIQITKPASQLLNDHRWYGVSLEGEVPEFHVECKGSANLWDACRWEATFPKVKIDGATAVRNRFRDGYNLHNVAFTHANGAFNTRVSHGESERWAPAPGAPGIFILCNANASGDPIIRLLDAGKDPLAQVVGSTDWSADITSRSIKGKQSTDGGAVIRALVDFFNGFVGGSTGLMAGGSSAATTPGAVVKKQPIYDMTGTLLGYIPIYSSIT